MFDPIVTDRLVIRAFQPDDLDAFCERRNEPRVAEYQDWTIPFPRDQAERMVASAVATDGPVDEEWWMVIVADRDSGEVYGDLAVRLENHARIAEVGYTFTASSWGNGYAVESLEAFVAYLFADLDIDRVFGMLHPGNPASAMVLERTGFRFEGHTRRSFWLDGDVSDDWIYGLVRDDWDTWRNRPLTPPNEVQLIEVTVDNVGAVAALRTHKSQERFVDPMSGSFADALFPEIYDGAPVVPWLRAIEADGEIVGFTMLAVSTEHHANPFLWRFLIDRAHQRRGIGSSALALIEQACMDMGDSTLETSWVEGKGSPAPFYLAHGFSPTGDLIDGEVEARKSLGGEDAVTTPDTVNP